MQVPTLYKVSQVTGNQLTQTTTKCVDGSWIPVRPMSIGGVLKRLKLAWFVFIGRYDALDWEEERYLANNPMIGALNELEKAKRPRQQWRKYPNRPKKPAPPPGRVGYEHEQPKEDR